MIPEAREAVKGEYAKLRKSGAWDESKVREWSDVVKESRERRAKKQMLKGPLRGRVFPLCVVKNSEIAHLRSTRGALYSKETMCVTNLACRHYFLIKVAVPAL